MKKILLSAVLFAGFCYADPPPELPQAPKASTSTVRSIALTGETQFSSETPRGMTVAPEDTSYTLTRHLLTKKDWPANTDIVTLDDMRMFGVRNAGEAVMRLAGVQTLARGEPNTPLGAGIRGGTDRQTLVLVDGRSVSGIGLDPADLTEIPIEQIDHIEVVRGGMSALYGPNATGGVINILTKRAANNGLPLSHVSYEARSYSSHQTRLDFGSRWDRLDFTFYGNAYRLSGFRDNTETRATNLGGNIGYAFKNAGKLQLDIANFHRYTGVPGPDPGNLTPGQFNDKDEKLSLYPNARADTDVSYVRSSYIVPLPDDQRLAVRVFDTERTVEYTDLDDANNISHFEDDSRSRGTDIQWDGPLGLNAGGSFTHDRLDHADQLVADRSFTAQAEDWGLFAQDLAHVGWFNLSAAGRYDHTSRAGNFWSPRAQLWIDATDWLRVSASAARSFTLPRLADLFLVTPQFVGNAQLRAEKASTYDAGFELHKDSNTLRVTFYKSIVSDALQIRPITLDTVDNIADVRRQGAEIEWSRVFTRWLQSDLRYTFLENRGRPDGAASDVELAESPRHRFDWIVTLHPYRKLRVDADFRYLGTRYAGHDQTGEKQDGDGTLDLRFSWPWRQADLYIGTQNTLNKRYDEVQGYPLPGRTVYGGIQLRLWG